MNRFFRWSLSIIGIALLLLIVTCPTDEDYFEWLSNKHNISCITTGNGIVCKDNNKNIEWKSRHIRNAGIFMLVEDEYSDTNTIYKIKAVGILSVFIDHSISGSTALK